MATKEKQKEYKCVSHAERMQANRKFADAAKERISLLADAVERVLSTEYERDEHTGRVITVNKVKSRKVSERNKGLKVNDFALESLIAVGATDGLKFSQLEGSIDMSLDNIDRLLDAIDAADAAAKTKAEPVDDGLGY